MTYSYKMAPWLVINIWTMQSKYILTTNVAQLWTCTNIESLNPAYIPDQHTPLLWFQIYFCYVFNCGYPDAMYIDFPSNATQ
jgi:hypothetical protein